MVVRSEQSEAAAAVTKRGRVRRRASATAVIATLMLLVGLVSPVAAAVPDAPTNLNATATSSTSASLTWTPTASPITSYRIAVSPALTPAPANPGPAANNATLSGLTPGVVYTINLFAVDGADESATSASDTVTTPAATSPTAAPGGVTMVAEGSNQLKISWSLVAAANNGGQGITGYEYSLNDGVTWVSAGGPTATTVTTPVQAAGSYQARVRAVNGIAPGGVASGQTTPAVTITPAATSPTAAPGGVTMVAEGANQLKISWSLVAAANNGGQGITGYEYSLNDGASWVSAGGPTATTVTTPAQAAGSYQARVRAINGIAPGGTPSPQTTPAISIAPAAPGAPGTPAVSNTGSTINVSWGAASGTVTNYAVTLTRAGAGPQNQTVAGTSASFANQVAGDYTVSVVASNGGVAGPPVNAPFTLTLAASAVTNVGAAVDSANRVTITWDPPVNDGGGVGQYRVSLSPAEAGPTTVPGTTLQATFSGLPGGDYTATVVALNAAGTGAAGTTTFSIVVAPGSPLNVKTTAASTTDGTATVTWDPPANNGNGTISEYVVRLGGETVTVPAASPRSANFTGLPIGKLTATVTAINAQGESAAGSSPEFFSKRLVHPFATREAFVRQAFQDLFDVNPTDAELANYAQATAADGSNAPAVITSLMQSQRFETRRQVSRLYFAYFLRVPDAAGQNYWADLMDRGVISLQGVSDEFARSPEFINTYGGLNEPEFLVVVYNNVLLRTPDLDGFNYWLGERNKGLTRGGVMTWFTEGREFIGLSLPAIDTSLAHITLLDRSPTTGEYALWFNRINNSSDSLETLVAAIWASDEFAARVNPN